MFGASLCDTSHIWAHQNTNHGESSAQVKTIVCAHYRHACPLLYYPSVALAPNITTQTFMYTAIIAAVGCDCCDDVRKDVRLFTKSYVRIWFGVGVHAFNACSNVVRVLMVAANSPIQDKHIPPITHTHAAIPHESDVWRQSTATSASADDTTFYSVRRVRVNQVGWRALTQSIVSNSVPYRLPSEYSSNLSNTRSYINGDPVRAAHWWMCMCCVSASAECCIISPIKKATTEPSLQTILVTSKTSSSSLDYLLQLHHYLHLLLEIHRRRHCMPLHFCAIFPRSSVHVLP